MDSILDTIKKALGLDAEYLVYDATIIAHINTILLALKGIGVGPSEGFSITGNTETWVDFLGEDPNLESIETYVISEVRKLFDPLKIEPGDEIPDSILGTIKKMLGITYSDTGFDTDIITDINSVFMILNQIGVGPKTCFLVHSNSEIWTDFLEDVTNLEAVKTYIYLKVRLVFDPPISSTFLDALTRQVNELEWRLNAQAEQGLYVIVPVEDEEA